MPRSIRDGITDFLQHAVVSFGLYRSFAPRLERAVEAAGARQIVDLCSGGGGPWPRLAGQLRSVRSGEVGLVLTDLYPNAEALRRLAADRPGMKIRYVDRSVSALSVPSDLTGFRTLFSSFHHFPPKAACSLLQDCVGKRQPVAIAESTQRHVLLILYMLLLAPFLVILTSPFQKPFRWLRLFWTYAVPVIPICVVFDGIVSCLRTYSPAELLGLTDGLVGGDTFTWEAGVEPLGPFGVGITYLIGLPKSSGS